MSGQNILEGTIETLQALFDVIEECVFIVNEFGQILEMNQPAIDKLGYTREELLGQNIMMIYPPESRKEAFEKSGQIQQGNTTDNMLPLYTKQGKYIFAQTHLFMGKWDGKNAAVGIVRDMTFRKTAEKKLRENDEKYLTIVKNAPGIIMVHKEGKIVFVEGAILETFGYTKSEILGHELLEFATAESKGTIEAYIEKRAQGEKIDDYEMTFITKNRVEVELLVKTSPMIYEQEPAILVVLMDITARKRAEKQVSRKEKILSAVAMSIKEFLDNNDYIEAVRKSFEMLGTATEVDRVYLFQNYTDEYGVAYTTQRIEWNSMFCEPQINNPKLKDISHQQISSFIEPLARKEAYYGAVRELENDRTRQLLEEQNILSIVVIPIFINDCFWGFVGFDDCMNERHWSQAEFFALSAFANSMEKAIERNIFHEELKKSKREAEAANVLKSQFLANMSHEIRTPMNGIVGFVDLMLRTDLTQEQQEYLEQVKSASESLLLLINDILDYSKIEADKLELEHIAFNVHNLVKEAAAFFAPKIKDKRLVMVLDIQPDVPETVYGDPNKLKQVLNNLLSNAVKFTKTGGIAILVSLLGSKENRIQIQFAVKDTGIGMSSEQIGKLFQVFTQADSSTTRKYGGTGLGLAISKRLVMLMEGKIQVESQLDKGASFYVTIEFETPDKQKIVTGINDTLKKELIQGFLNNNQKWIEKKDTVIYNDTDIANGSKVLLVEDKVSNQKLASIILNKLGYSVTLAENGKEAVSMCRIQKFDIILMDCQMPIMDGYEATARIKTDDGINKETVIVAMTANAMEGDRDKCIAAGMQDYISKPITVQKLGDIIEKWLNNASNRR